MLRRSVEDLHDPPAAQLLGVRMNVPGVHGALAEPWVKDFRKAGLVDLSTARNSRLWSCLRGPETTERDLSIPEVSHASLNPRRAVSILADFLLTNFISGPSLPILVYQFGGWPLTGDGDCAFGEAFTLTLALILRSSPSDPGFLPGFKGIGGFTGSESLICSADIVEVGCSS